MSLLREYIRELLTEGAKTPDQLPRYAFVQLINKDTNVSAKIVTKKGKRPGFGKITGVVHADLIEPDLSIDDNGALHTSGETYGAFEVGLSRADPGWGPMLYDVVLEAVTQKGSGLTPDRYSVSDDALNIWDHYLHHRPDVDWAQLDFEPGYPVHITEDPIDDSTMQYRYKDLYHEDPVVRKRAQQEYLEGPLSKVYYAVGTPTLDKLRSAGKLIE